jgi:hypothetical protein
VEAVEWTKIKYTHSGNTQRIPFEHQLKYLLIMKEMTVK